MAQRKWNGSGEMREVNEMYLGLNTLRDRFGIGPLIKNHSEGELMWRDRVRPRDAVVQRERQSHPEELPQESLFLHVIISRERAIDLQLNTHL